VDIGFSKRIASWLCGLRVLTATSPDSFLTGFGFGPASAKVAPHNFCHWLNRSLNRPHGGHNCAAQEVVDAVLEEKVRQVVRECWRYEVSRDATVSYRDIAYPVPPEYVGRHVWLHPVDSKVVIMYAGNKIADHPLAGQAPQV